MVNVSIFDGCTLIVYILCLFLAIFYKFDKKWQELKNILLIIILLSIFDALSNFLEWQFNIGGLDEIEDYFDILKAIAWIFFINFYLHHRDRQIILRHQEEIIKLEKNESIATMAGGITHDFRNHLGIIIGSLNLLEFDDNLDDEAKENINAAKIAAEKASKISTDLLGLTKNFELNFSTNNLCPLIKSLTTLILRNSKIEIIYEGFDDDINIECDKIQIERVFQNILLNAAQAMENHGNLEIRLKKITITNQEIFGLIAGKYVIIDIEDSGPGIESEEILSIFDPFFTTKPDGTGLGLSVAFNIVQKHRGTILVQSERGKGTCFSIYLPL